MEKKLTRDQHLIRLINESAAKDERIKDLEKDKKAVEKRLKKLEEDFKKLNRLVAASTGTIRVLKEKTSNHEHDLTSVKQTLRKK